MPDPGSTHSRPVDGEPSGALRACPGCSVPGAPVVLLVLPNLRWGRRDSGVNWTIWPISLCVISAVLEPRYHVEILDANLDDLPLSVVEERVREMRPMVVGISVFCDDFAEAGHATAAAVKAVSVSTPVVMGGSYVTLNPDLATRDGCVDYFVVGEGELVFRELLEWLRGQSDAPPAAGVVQRDEHGSLVGPGPRAPIAPLDQLPFPMYEKIDFQKYASHEDRKSAYMPPLFPYGRVTTSRGCPCHCCFCQVGAINGAGIRYRSAANVLAEVEMLVRDHGIRSLLVDDANFTADRRRAKEIIGGFLERGFNLQWRIMNLAAYTLDAELLDLMMRSGCDHVDLAIESGSQRVLKEIIHKPLSLKHTEELIGLAKGMGFMISANFIIGFPGETWDEIRETVRFAERIDVDYVKFMVAMPLRHTELYETAATQGLLRTDFDFMDMRWGLGEISTDEFSALDTTILRTYEWDRVNFSSPEKIRRVARLMGVDEGAIATMRADTRKSLGRLLQARA